MIPYSDFKKYFNRDFWKSFKRLPFDVKIPKKEEFVKNVYSLIVTKEYYPSIPIRYIDIDKGNGVTRTVPVFDIKDYCVYYFCIKVLECKIAVNRVSNTFGGWTLGGAMRRTEDEETFSPVTLNNNFNDLIEASVNLYSFNPYAWSAVYGDFNSKLYATASDCESGYVAELDIANFYDSIRLDILENKIREITSSDESEVVSLLFHFLNHWNRDVNFYNGQTVGLPQDALGDFSRILANFYLQDYDFYMKTKADEVGGVYFRYADDQFLFAPSNNLVKKLVFLASKKLNCFSLNINQKKVVYRKTEELISHRSFDIFEILGNEDTRDDPEVIERFVDEYLKVREEGLNSLRGRGLPLLGKMLFRNIESLPIDKKAVVISDLLSNEFILKIGSDKLTRIYSLLHGVDRNRFVLKLINLSLESYHNAFHYELIKFLKLKRIDSRVVKSRIKYLKKMYELDV